MSDTPYVPKDRRPIAARKSPLWQNVAKRMAQRGYSPNGISLAGMVCGVLAGVMFALTIWMGTAAPLFWLLSAVFIQLRLLANLLDGMVAIESGKASPVGELYNEIPDRVSDFGTLVGAGYALGGSPVLGYIAASAAIFTAYIRAMGKAAGTPQFYCGPMAKQHRMALMTGIAVGCAILPRAWQPLWHGTSGPGIMAVGLLVAILGCLVTVVRRLSFISGSLRNKQT